MTAATTPPSLLQFPCTFPIKAIGRGDDFQNEITAVVRCHVPKPEALAIHSRPSQGGKYLAVTFTLHADSQAQLDAIYRDLTAHPAVLMAL